jgi:hypothetical protein
MGAATRGGGAVTSGPQNKMLSETSKTSGPVMMEHGGAVNQHKRMAMGKPIKKMDGGMMSKGYAAGGAAKKRDGGMMSKGYAAGGALKKMAKRAK